MSNTPDADSDWAYAKRDCPKCGSDNTWTNTDDFKCDDCGFDTRASADAEPERDADE